MFVLIVGNFDAFVDGLIAVCFCCGLVLADLWDLKIRGIVWE